MNTILVIAALVVVFLILFKVFKLITRLLVIAVFLLLAFVTNPNEKAHKDAVQEKARKHSLPYRPDKVKVKNLLVASLTQQADNGDTKTIGVGLFTKVFILRNPE